MGRYIFAQIFIMSNEKEAVTPYDSGLSKKKQVAAMFNKIAHKYDFLNHLLSLGIDRLWRKKTVDMIAKINPSALLDIATGTGDLSFAAAKKMKLTMITGVDISEGMLGLAVEKARKIGLSDRISFHYGDSENLDFEPETFDAIMVAFGVRNFENLDQGLKEMCRVLKPGGSVFILEFSKPRIFPLKTLFNVYFKYILPRIGRYTSRDYKAYTYLFESVQAFPDFENFVTLLEKAGFHSNKFYPMTFGICTIYTGKK